MAFILRNLSSFIFGGQSLAPPAPASSDSAIDEEQQPPTGVHIVLEQDSTPLQQPRPSVDHRPRSAAGPPSPFLTNVLEASRQSLLESRPGPIPTRFGTNQDDRQGNNVSRDAERESEQPPPYRSRDHQRTIPEPYEDRHILPGSMEREERRFCLLSMQRASLPENRFQEQVQREKTRILEKYQACNLKTDYRLQGSELTQRARENVQRRWERQGISKEGTWFCGPSTDPFGFWKHQEIRNDHGPEEVCKLDMSRPYFQFMHEVAMERDHIEFLRYPPRLPDGLITAAIPPSQREETTPDDLHTAAYSNVRYDQWVANGLWDASWGQLPGMFWKHETDIRSRFQAEFNSVDHIPQRYLDMSDSLQRQETFRNRRFGCLGFLPKALENQLLSAQQGLGWPDEVPLPVDPMHIFYPELQPHAEEENNADPRSSHFTLDSQRSPASRVAPASMHRQEQMAQSEDGSSPGSSSSDSLPPLSAHRRPQDLASAGSSGQRAPSGEEHTPSETSSGALYGDENADDFLDAVSRQIVVVQDLAQQALDAQKQLAAQFSAVRGSYSRRQRIKEESAARSPQRHVLGPLPSTQRVSKKGKGKTVPGRTGLLGLGASPASSTATTVILAPLRPEDRGHSVESRMGTLSFDRTFLRMGTS